jgi:hypothetical protein
VNNYAAHALSSCANLTTPQKQLVTTVLDLFLNKTLVDAGGLNAAIARATYNTGLSNTSWIYVGGLASVCVALGAAACRIKTDWSALVAENLTLVTLLGLYEWMFFQTVVLRYQSISVQELDRMVVDEFATSC